MSHFEQEIHQQPDVLRRLLAEGQGEVRALAARILEYQPHSALLAARGSSDNAARYGGYLLGALHGLQVGLALPSLFTVYEQPPRLGRTLVMGISQSGRSPDIVAVIAEGRRQGALTVAITNDAASPLAAAAEHVLVLRAGEERAVAATKTYVAQLMTLAMLAAALTGEAGRWQRAAGWVRRRPATATPSTSW
jgi:glucosamine--fructose-6-phosphate aminotransferase (isomerizing)